MRGGAQGQLDVTHVCLGHQGDNGGTRVEQGPDLRVIGGHGARTPGRTKSSQRGSAQRKLPLRTGEELGVLGVGPGPTAFDVADPELIQERRNGQLVCDRKVQTLLLRTVTQRGVVDVQVGHRLPLSHL